MKNYILAKIFLIILTVILTSCKNNNDQYLVSQKTSSFHGSTNCTSSPFLTIQNSKFHPLHIINEHGEAKEIVILEETKEYYHPNIGWSSPSLKLTAWEHFSSVKTKPIWILSINDKLTINWSLNERSSRIMMTIQTDPSIASEKRECARY